MRSRRFLDRPPARNKLSPRMSAKKIVRLPVPQIQREDYDSDMRHLFIEVSLFAKLSQNSQLSWGSLFITPKRAAAIGMSALRRKAKTTLCLPLACSFIPRFHASSVH